ncbi:aspartate carbamoyltransferase catalytic subunit [Thalassobacillus pellis]|uniref:aspartate carbamoyltransferase catalytic subunit n=1 Tax=Thalassobacillus pellis TaxID=748008 RepID=UPI001961BBE7|nr:aspartate carbamoyltransferase catalytic subunit [Thalassobacillus pellis]MBM7552828.1 aspartate carbamoyltransferase catalytic subunit [Thalassobacillus pellis]
MKDILSMEDLTDAQIYQLLETAEKIESEGSFPFHDQKYAANLFLEPSTRTKNSFFIAERRLGMEVMDVSGSDSSLTKGESLYDTVKTLYTIGASLCIIRQSQNGILREIANEVDVPIINAGDGTGQHPSQSLLDLYTIYQEFGGFTGIKVAIVGDIKHSRVARSNGKALERLGAEVFYASKPEWQDDSISTNYLSIDQAVELADVVMLLRIQHERHEQKAESDSYLEAFGLTEEREKKMNKNAIIMHPAPVNRGVEIAGSLVEAPRSRIFTQMKNGVTIRMAMINALLKEEL